MKKLILLLFVFSIFQIGFSQVLPTFQGIHKPTINLPLGPYYGPNCFDNNITYYFSVAICNSRYAVSINAGSNFNFDSNTKGSKIVLSNNNKTVGSTQAAGSSCQWQSVYLLPGISMGTGTKTVEFTIDSYSNTPSNSFDMVIGVDQGNNNGSSLFCNPSGNNNIGGYGWIAQIGALYGFGVSSNCLSGGNTPSYGTPYGQGDIIKIVFDTNNGNLTFCKNNVCY